MQTLVLRSMWMGTLLIQMINNLHLKYVKRDGLSLRREVEIYFQHFNTFGSNRIPRRGDLMRVCVRVILFKITVKMSSSSNLKNPGVF